MRSAINIEIGYKQSYMDKNLFVLGLEQLTNVGLKFLMEEFKKGIEAKDFWKLRTTACSLKEIADYHGTTLLAFECSKIKLHADKNEIDHIYPIYTTVAREVFYMRRALIKYIKENKGTV